MHTQFLELGAKALRKLKRYKRLVQERKRKLVSLLVAISFLFSMTGLDAILAHAYDPNQNRHENYFNRDDQRHDQANPNQDVPGAFDAITLAITQPGGLKPAATDAHLNVLSAEYTNLVSTVSLKTLAEQATTGNLPALAAALAIPGQTQPGQPPVADANPVPLAAANPIPAADVIIASNGPLTLAANLTSGNGSSPAKLLGALPIPGAKTEGTGTGTPVVHALAQAAGTETHLFSGTPATGTNSNKQLLVAGTNGTDTNPPARNVLAPTVRANLSQVLDKAVTLPGGGNQTGTNNAKPDVKARAAAAANQFLALLGLKTNSSTTDGTVRALAVVAGNNAAQGDAASLDGNHDQNDKGPLFPIAKKKAAPVLASTDSVVDAFAALPGAKDKDKNKATAAGASTLQDLVAIVSGKNKPKPEATATTDGSGSPAGQLLSLLGVDQGQGGMPAAAAAAATTLVDVLPANKAKKTGDGNGVTVDVSALAAAAGLPLPNGDSTDGGPASPALFTGKSKQVVILGQDKDKTNGDDSAAFFVLGADAKGTGSANIALVGPDSVSTGSGPLGGTNLLASGPAAAAASAMFVFNPMGAANQTAGAAVPASRPDYMGVLASALQNGVQLITSGDHNPLSGQAGTTADTKPPAGDLPADVVGTIPTAMPQGQTTARQLPAVNVTSSNNPLQEQTTVKYVSFGPVPGTQTVDIPAPPATDPSVVQPDNQSWSGATDNNNVGGGSDPWSVAQMQDHPSPPQPDPPKPECSDYFTFAVVHILFAPFVEGKNFFEHPSWDSFGSWMWSLFEPVSNNIVAVNNFSWDTMATYGKFAQSLPGKIIMLVATIILSIVSFGTAAPVLIAMYIAIEMLQFFVPLPKWADIFVSIVKAAIGGWAGALNQMAKEAIKEMVKLSITSIVKLISSLGMKEVYKAIIKAVLKEIMMIVIGESMSSSKFIVWRTLAGLGAEVLSSGLTELVTGGNLGAGLLQGTKNILGIGKENKVSLLVMVSPLARAGAGLAISMWMTSVHKDQRQGLLAGAVYGGMVTGAMESVAVVNSYKSISTLQAMLVVSTTILRSATAGALSTYMQLWGSTQEKTKENPNGKFGKYQTLALGDAVSQTGTQLMPSYGFNQNTNSFGWSNLGSDLGNAISSFSNPSMVTVDNAQDAKAIVSGNGNAAAAGGAGAAAASASAGPGAGNVGNGASNNPSAVDGVNSALGAQPLAAGGAGPGTSAAEEPRPDSPKDADSSDSDSSKADNNNQTPDKQQQKSGMPAPKDLQQQNKPSQAPATTADKPKPQNVAADTRRSDTNVAPSPQSAPQEAAPQTLPDSNAPQTLAAGSLPGSKSDQPADGSGRNPNTSDSNNPLPDDHQVNVKNIKDLAHTPQSGAAERRNDENGTPQGKDSSSGSGQGGDGKGGDGKGDKGNGKGKGDEAGQGANVSSAGSDAIAPQTMPNALATKQQLQALAENNGSAPAAPAKFTPKAGTGPVTTSLDGAMVNSNAAVHQTLQALNQSGALKSIDGAATVRAETFTNADGNQVLMLSAVKANGSSQLLACTEKVGDQFITTTFAPGPKGQVVADLMVGDGKTLTDLGKVELKSKDLNLAKGFDAFSGSGVDRGSANTQGSSHAGAGKRDSQGPVARNAGSEENTEGAAASQGKSSASGTGATKKPGAGNEVSADAAAANDQAQKSKGTPDDDKEGTGAKEKTKSQARSEKIAGTVNGKPVEMTVDSQGRVSLDADAQTMADYKAGKPLTVILDTSTKVQVKFDPTSKLSELSGSSETLQSLAGSAASRTRTLDVSLPNGKEIRLMVDQTGQVTAAPLPGNQEVIDGLKPEDGNKAVKVALPNGKTARLNVDPQGNLSLQGSMDGLGQAMRRAPGISPLDGMAGWKVDAKINGQTVTGRVTPDGNQMTLPDDQAKAVKQAAGDKREVNVFLPNGTQATATISEDGKQLSFSKPDTTPSQSAPRPENAQEQMNRADHPLNPSAGDQKTKGSEMYEQKSSDPFFRKEDTDKRPSSLNADQKIVHDRPAPAHGGGVLGWAVDLVYNQSVAALDKLGAYTHRVTEVQVEGENGAPVTLQFEEKFYTGATAGNTFEAKGSDGNDYYVTRTPDGTTDKITRKVVVGSFWTGYEVAYQEVYPQASAKAVTMDEYGQVYGEYKKDSKGEWQMVARRVYTSSASGMQVSALLDVAKLAGQPRRARETMALIANVQDQNLLAASPQFQARMKAENLRPEMQEQFAKALKAEAIACAAEAVNMAQKNVNAVVGKLTQPDENGVAPETALNYQQNPAYKTARSLAAQAGLAQHLVDPNHVKFNQLVADARAGNDPMIMSQVAAMQTAEHDPKGASATLTLAMANLQNLTGPAKAAAALQIMASAQANGQAIPSEAQAILNSAALAPVQVTNPGAMDLALAMRLNALSDQNQLPPSFVATMAASLSGQVNAAIASMGVNETSKEIPGVGTLTRDASDHYSLQMKQGDNTVTIAFKPADENDPRSRPVVGQVVISDSLGAVMQFECKANGDYTLVAQRVVVQVAAGGAGVVRELLIPAKSIVGNQATTFVRDNNARLYKVVINLDTHQSQSLMVFDSKADRPATLDTRNQGITMSFDRFGVLGLGSGVMGIGGARTPMFRDAYGKVQGSLQTGVGLEQMTSLGLSPELAQVLATQFKNIPAYLGPGGTIFVGSEADIKAGNYAVLGRDDFGSAGGSVGYFAQFKGGVINRVDLSNGQIVSFLNGNTKNYTVTQYSADNNRSMVALYENGQLLGYKVTFQDLGGATLQYDSLGNLSRSCLEKLEAGEFPGVIYRATAGGFTLTDARTNRQYLFDSNGHRLVPAESGAAAGGDVLAQESMEFDVSQTMHLNIASYNNSRGVNITIENYAKRSVSVSVGRDEPQTITRVITHTDMFSDHLVQATQTYVRTKANTMGWQLQRLVGAESDLLASKLVTPDIFKALHSQGDQARLVGGVQYHDPNGLYTVNVGYDHNRVNYSLSGTLPTPAGNVNVTASLDNKTGILNASQVTGSYGALIWANLGRLEVTKASLGQGQVGANDTRYEINGQYTLGLGLNDETNLVNVSLIGEIKTAVNGHPSKITVIASWDKGNQRLAAVETIGSKGALAAANIVHIDQQLGKEDKTVLGERGGAEIIYTDQDGRFTVALDAKKSADDATAHHSLIGHADVEVTRLGQKVTDELAVTATLTESKIKDHNNITKKQPLQFELSQFRGAGDVLQASGLADPDHTSKYTMAGSMKLNYTDKRTGDYIVTVDGEGNPSLMASGEVMVNGEKGHVTVISTLAKDPDTKQPRFKAVTAIGSKEALKAGGIMDLAKQGIDKAGMVTGKNKQKVAVYYANPETNDYTINLGEDGRNPSVVGYVKATYAFTGFWHQPGTPEVPNPEAVAGQGLPMSDLDLAQYAEQHDAQSGGKSHALTRFQTNVPDLFGKGANVSYDQAGRTVVVATPLLVEENVSIIASAKFPGGALSVTSISGTADGLDKSGVVDLRATLNRNSNIMGMPAAGTTGKAAMASRPMLVPDYSDGKGNFNLGVDDKGKFSMSTKIITDGDPVTVFCQLNAKRDSFVAIQAEGTADAFYRAGIVNIPPALKAAGIELPYTTRWAYGSYGKKDKTTGITTYTLGIDKNGQHSMEGWLGRVKIGIQLDGTGKLFLAKSATATGKDAIRAMQQVGLIDEDVWNSNKDGLNQLKGTDGKVTAQTAEYNEKLKQDLPELVTKQASMEIRNNNKDGHALFIKYEFTKTILGKVFKDDVLVGIGLNTDVRHKYYFQVVKGSDWILNQLGLTKIDEKGANLPTTMQVGDRDLRCSYTDEKGNYTLAYSDRGDHQLITTAKVTLINAETRKSTEYTVTGYSSLHGENNKYVAGQMRVPGTVAMAYNVPLVKLAEQGQGQDYTNQGMKVKINYKDPDGNYLIAINSDKQGAESLSLIGSVELPEGKATFVASVDKGKLEANVAMGKKDVLAKLGVADKELAQVENVGGQLKDKPRIEYANAEGSYTVRLNQGVDTTGFGTVGVGFQLIGTMTTSRGFKLTAMAGESTDENGAASLKVSTLTGTSAAFYDAKIAGDQISGVQNGEGKTINGHAVEWKRDGNYTASVSEKDGTVSASLIGSLHTDKGDITLVGGLVKGKDDGEHLVGKDFRAVQALGEENALLAAGIGNEQIAADKKYAADKTQDKGRFVKAFGLDKGNMNGKTEVAYQKLQDGKTTYAVSLNEAAEGSTSQFSYSLVGMATLSNGKTMTVIGDLVNDTVSYNRIVGGVEMDITQTAENTQISTKAGPDGERQTQTLGKDVWIKPVEGARGKGNIEAADITGASVLLNAAGVDITGYFSKLGNKFVQAGSAFMLSMHNIGKLWNGLPPASNMSFWQNLKVSTAFVFSATAITIGAALSVTLKSVGAVLAPVLQVTGWVLEAVVKYPVNAIGYMFGNAKAGTQFIAGLQGGLKYYSEHYEKPVFEAVQKFCEAVAVENERVARDLFAVNGWAAIPATIAGSFVLFGAATTRFVGENAPVIILITLAAFPPTAGVFGLVGMAMMAKDAIINGMEGMFNSFFVEPFEKVSHGLTLMAEGIMHGDILQFSRGISTIAGGVLGAVLGYMLIKGPLDIARRAKGEALLESAQVREGLESILAEPNGRARLSNMTFGELVRACVERSAELQGDNLSVGTIKKLADFATSKLGRVKVGDLSITLELGQPSISLGKLLSTPEGGATLGKFLRSKEFSYSKFTAKLESISEQAIKPKQRGSEVPLTKVIRAENVGLGKLAGNRAYVNGFFKGFVIHQVESAKHAWTQLKNLPSIIARPFRAGFNSISEYVKSVRETVAAREIMAVKAKLPAAVLQALLAARAKLAAAQATQAAQQASAGAGTTGTNSQPTGDSQEVMQAKAELSAVEGTPEARKLVALEKSAQARVDEATTAAEGFTQQAADLTAEASKASAAAETREQAVARKEAELAKAKKLVVPDFLKAANDAKIKHLKGEIQTLTDEVAANKQAAETLTLQATEVKAKAEVAKSEAKLAAAEKELVTADAKAEAKTKSARKDLRTELKANQAKAAALGSQVALALHSQELSQADDVKKLKEHAKKTGELGRDANKTAKASDKAAEKYDQAKAKTSKNEIKDLLKEAKEKVANGKLSERELNRALDRITSRMGLTQEARLALKHKLAKILSDPEHATAADVKKAFEGENGKRQLKQMAKEGMGAEAGKMLDKLMESDDYQASLKLDPRVGEADLRDAVAEKLGLPKTGNNQTTISDLQIKAAMDALFGDSVDHMLTTDQAGHMNDIQRSGTNKAYDELNRNSMEGLSKDEVSSAIAKTLEENFGQQMENGATVVGRGKQGPGMDKAARENLFKKLGQRMTKDQFEALMRSDDPVAQLLDLAKQMDAVDAKLVTAKGESGKARDQKVTKATKAFDQEVEAAKVQAKDMLKTMESQLETAGVVKDSEQWNTEMGKAKKAAADQQAHAEQAAVDKLNKTTQAAHEAMQAEVNEAIAGDKSLCDLLAGKDKGGEGISVRNLRARALDVEKARAEVRKATAAYNEATTQRQLQKAKARLDAAKTAEQSAMRLAELKPGKGIAWPWSAESRARAEARLSAEYGIEVINVDEALAGASPALAKELRPKLEEMRDAQKAIATLEAKAQKAASGWRKFQEKNYRDKLQKEVEKREGLIKQLQEPGKGYLDQLLKSAGMDAMTAESALAKVGLKSVELLKNIRAKALERVLLDALKQKVGAGLEAKLKSLCESLAKTDDIFNLKVAEEILDQQHPDLATHKAAIVEVLKARLGNGTDRISFPKLEVAEPGKPKSAPGKMPVAEFTQAEMDSMRAEMVKHLTENMPELNATGREVLAQRALDFQADAKYRFFSPDPAAHAFLFRQAELHYIKMELHVKNPALKALTGEALQLAMGGGKSCSVSTLITADTLFRRNHPGEEPPAMAYTTKDATLVAQLAGGEPGFQVFKDQGRLVVLSKENVKAEVIDKGGFQKGKLYLMDCEAMKSLVLDMRNKGYSDAKIANILQKNLGTVAADEFHAYFHMTDTIIGASGIVPHLSSKALAQWTGVAMAHIELYAQVREWFRSQVVDGNGNVRVDKVNELFVNVENAPGKEVRGQVRFSDAALKGIKDATGLDYSKSGDAHLLDDMGTVLASKNGREYCGELKQDGSTEYGTAKGGDGQPNTIFGKQLQGAFTHAEIFLDKTGMTAEEIANDPSFTVKNEKFVAKVIESLVHTTTQRVTMMETLKLLGQQNLVAFSGTFEGIESSLNTLGLRLNKINAEPQAELAHVLKGQVYYRIKVGDQVLLMRREGQQVVMKWAQEDVAIDQAFTDDVVALQGEHLANGKIRTHQIVTGNDNPALLAKAEAVQKGLAVEGRPSLLTKNSAASVENFIQDNQQLLADKGIEIKYEKGANGERVLTPDSARAVIKEMLYHPASAEGFIRDNSALLEAKGVKIEYETKQNLTKDSENAIKQLMSEEKFTGKIEDFISSRKSLLAEKGIDVSYEARQLTKQSAADVKAEIDQKIAKDGSAPVHLIWIDGMAPAFKTYAMKIIEDMVTGNGGWTQERIIFGPNIAEGLNTVGIKAGVNDNMSASLHQLDARPLDVDRQTKYRLNVEDLRPGTFKRAEGMTGSYFDCNSIDNITRAEREGMGQFISEVHQAMGGGHEMRIDLTQKDGKWQMAEGDPNIKFAEQFNDLLVGLGDKNPITGRTEGKGLAKTMLEEVDTQKTTAIRETLAGIQHETTTSVSVDQASAEYMPELARIVEAKTPELLRKNQGITDLVAKRNGADSSALSKLLQKNGFDANALKSTGGWYRQVPILGWMSHKIDTMQSALDTSKSKISMVTQYAKTYQDEKWLADKKNAGQIAKLKAQYGTYWFDEAMNAKFGADWKIYQKMGFALGLSQASLPLVGNLLGPALGSAVGYFQLSRVNSLVGSECQQAIRNVAAVSETLATLQKNPGSTVDYQGKTMSLADAVRYVQTNLTAAQALAQRYGIALSGDLRSFGAQLISLPQQSSATGAPAPQAGHAVAQPAASATTGLTPSAWEMATIRLQALAETQNIQDTSAFTRNVLQPMKNAWENQVRKTLTEQSKFLPFKILEVNSGGWIRMTRPTKIIFSAAVGAVLLWTGAGVGAILMAVVMGALVKDPGSAMKGVGKMVSGINKKWGEKLSSFSSKSKDANSKYKTLGSRIGGFALTAALTSFQGIFDHSAFLVLFLNAFNELAEHAFQVSEKELNRAVVNYAQEQASGPSGSGPGGGNGGPGGSGGSGGSNGGGQGNGPTVLQAWQNAYSAAGGNSAQPNDTLAASSLRKVLLERGVDVAIGESAQQYGYMHMLAAVLSLLPDATESLSTVELAADVSQRQASANKAGAAGIRLDQSSIRYLDQTYSDILLTQLIMALLPKLFGDAQANSLNIALSQHHAYKQYGSMALVEFVKQYIMDGENLRSLAKNDATIQQVYLAVQGRLGKQFSGDDLKEIAEAAGEMENQGYAAMKNMAQQIEHPAPQMLQGYANPAEFRRMAEQTFEATFGIAYSAYRGSIQPSLVQRLLVKVIGKERLMGATPETNTRVMSNIMIGWGICLIVVGGLLILGLLSGLLPVAVGGTLLVIKLSWALAVFWPVAAFGGSLAGVFLLAEGISARVKAASIAFNLDPSAAVHERIKTAKFESAAMDAAAKEIVPGSNEDDAFSSSHGISAAEYQKLSVQVLLEDPSFNQAVNSLQVKGTEQMISDTQRSRAIRLALDHLLVVAESEANNETKLALTRDVVQVLGFLQFDVSLEYKTYADGLSVTLTPEAVPRAVSQDYRIGRIVERLGGLGIGVKLQVAPEQNKPKLKLTGNAA